MVFVRSVFPLSIPGNQSIAIPDAVLPLPPVAGRRAIGREKSRPILILSYRDKPMVPLNSPGEDPVTPARGGKGDPNSETLFGLTQGDGR